jgi:hypothetical protein
MVVAVVANQQFDPFVSAGEMPVLVRGTGHEWIDSALGAAVRELPVWRGRRGPAGVALDRPGEPSRYN